MELTIEYEHYSEKTLEGWWRVWRTICEMAYSQTYIMEEIITMPAAGFSEKEHTAIYNKRLCHNEYDITLDSMWKTYSTLFETKMPYVCPMLKKLHVPRVLFEELGIRPWFKHSFPNCVITFWEE